MVSDAVSFLMADKSMEQLRSLLKSYDERTAKLQVAVKPVHDEGERRRRACGDRLRTVVRSVLDRFMDALKNAGHQAAIEDETATAGGYPTVALMLTPHTPAGTALASTLTFKCDPRRGIAVARDIKPSPTKRSEEHTSELQSRLHLVCRLLLEKKKKNQRMS